MSARIFFAALVLITIGFGAAAILSPGSQEYREPVPVSIGEPNAPVHLIVYGAVSLPEGIANDVAAGTTKVTLVEGDEAFVRCVSLTNCSSSEPMPDRFNPAGIEPLVRIGYRPEASVQLTQPDDVATEYEELKLRIGI